MKKPLKQNILNQKKAEIFLKNKEKAFTLEHFVNGIKTNNTAILSKAITLVESNKEDDKKLATALLNHIQHLTGKSIRLGISGVPGVGKSTFIEALGKHILDDGLKLGVLTIDPSSKISKGSILGDKTRMEGLVNMPNVFIRPSPSSGNLGGVARATHETILLLEAAGYNVIIIETVGVGQSETTVKNLVDFFLLLTLPGSGDELQGIKRGIMEIADAIAVNKAEEETTQKSGLLAKKQLENALHFFPLSTNGWQPKVFTCSALHNININEIWQNINQGINHYKKTGFFEQNRISQNIGWMHETLKNLLENYWFSNPQVTTLMHKLQTQLTENKISPYDAAQTLFEKIVNRT